MSEPTVAYSYCVSCGQRWTLPRCRCPACGSPEVATARAGGTGELIAVTVIRRAPPGAPKTPFAIGLIVMDAGFRLLVRCPITAAPGQRARLTDAKPPRVAPLDQDG